MSASEAGRQRFEAITVDEVLPSLEVEVSLTALVMYAGATWDFHRYHYDAGYVAERGYQAPFMDGQMAGALIARHVTAWAGPEAFVHRLAYRLRAMVFAGDRIRLGGRVRTKSSQDGRYAVGIDVEVVKADGARVVEGGQVEIEFACGARSAAGIGKGESR